MKRFLSLFLIAVLLVTAGCAVVGLPAGPAEAVPAATSVPEAAPGRTDFFEKVFDTSGDEGKLTVRYLRMTQDVRTGKDVVTSGDASVYTSPDGLVMLVDCSNAASADEVIGQLRAMGVDHIDIFVASHPHSDHIGGFPRIAETFPIGQIYRNDHEYDSGAYREMTRIIAEKGIPCRQLFDGDGFPFGELVTVRVFNPVPGAADTIGAGYMDANDCSLALRLEYGRSSFWTSGDLYVSGEQALLDRHAPEEIASDVMKMDHHGWSTSSKTSFIETISPLVAVAMHDSVTSRTVAMRHSTRGILTFFNCMDGAVRVSTSGDGVYDVQSQFVRQAEYYGVPSGDGHYVVSRGRSPGE